MSSTFNCVSKMRWLCVAFIASWAALAAGVCDSPWFEYNGRCYYTSPNAESDELVLSWRGAENWCLQNGGHLSTVESKEERDGIINVTIVGTYRGALWIGLNKLNDRVTYEWVDGTLSEYRDWAPGNPVDGGVGMCAYQITHPPNTCFTTDVDVNVMRTIVDKPVNVQPPETFKFWETFNLNDSVELPRCQQSCADEPNCFYYTFVSWSSMDFDWDGTCTGASANHEYNTVEDTFAYSGHRMDCEVVGTWYEGNCGEKRGFICERGVDDNPASVPTPAPTQSVSGFCPSGFFDAGGNKCFKIVAATEQEGLNWDESHQLCLAEKGVAPDLANIQSEYENAVITMRIREHYWGFWIGLRQSASYSDQWVWSDNQEPLYFGWAEGKPNGAGKCGEMWTNPGPIGTWNNQDCLKTRGYICQTYKNIDEIIATPGSTLAHSCKADYYNYGGICYKKVTASSDWSSALVTCQADGATLATVHSEAENAALYVYAADIAPFWIGYHTNEADKWVWTDDWPNTYSNWNAGEDPGTGGGCASFKDTGKWKDDACDNSINFVCMISTAIAPTTPAYVEGVCYDGWVEFGGFCYFFSDRYSILTWTQAERDCVNRAAMFSRGTLASIHGPEEDRFIYENFKNRTIEQAWIGLHEAESGSSHTWSDGSTLEYVHWAPGEPNDGEANDQQCVQMYINLWPGLWNDHWCDVDKFEYVCKAAKVDQITTPSTPPGLACPKSYEGQQTWIASGAYCYYYDPVSLLTFNAAQEFCVRLAGRDADLATIPNAYTNNLFFQMVQGTSSFAVWIGLTRPHANAEFRWLENVDVNFTNWLKGEPSNDYNKEHCVEMQTYAGEWNDMPCTDYTRPYICQIRMEDVLPPTSAPDSSVPTEPDGLCFTSGQLAGIIIAAILGTALLCAAGLFIWYLVRGGRVFSSGGKGDASDGASTYDLPYNNYDSSLSRSSSTRSATPSRSEA